MSDRGRTTTCGGCAIPIIGDQARCRVCRAVHDGTIARSPLVVFVEVFLLALGGILLAARSLGA